MMVLALLAPTAALGQGRSQIDGNTRAEPAAPAPAEAEAFEHQHAQGPLVLHGRLTPQQHADFAQALDLTEFRKLAVFADGRIKIVDTLAREHLQTVSGKTKWKSYAADNVGHAFDPVFMLLDLSLCFGFVDPKTGRVYDRYADQALVYVESTTLRRDLLQAIGLTGEDFERQMAARRLTPRQYHHPEVRAMLEGGDIQIQEQARQVRRAWNSLLASRTLLALTPPLPSLPLPASALPEDADKWLTLDQVAARLTLRNPGPSAPPADGAVAEVAPVSDVAVGDNTALVVEAWSALATAWRNADAPEAQAQIDELVRLLPTLHPDPQAYPSEARRAVEVLYNRGGRYAFGWAAYAMGAVSLLLAASTRRVGPATIGSLLLALGLVLHLANILTRTFLSGRWPIHNQYESFIAVAFFAVLVGAVLMWARRQWVFGVAAGAVGAGALMFAHFLPGVFPSKSVANDMPILATSNILYVHVNIVLFSYGLIALAFGLSVTYLLTHYLGRSKAVASVAAAGVGDTQLAETLAEPGSKRPATFGRKRLLGDLDTAQLVVMQLAFWLLGLGIILGAYWADHAWGRWWAWDPKETWALITWIVYLITIHARFGVKDRGLVTAWLGVVGFFVMLWCYWGVNLLLSGLHSYA
ncbi:MAG: cytochrome c biogenesis protein CcsA [Planctomycetota bacterium]